MEAILNISIGKGLGAVNILLLPCCRPLLFLLLCANTSFFGILTIWLHHWPFYQVTLLFQEKAMATHPSTLSWKIPHTRRSLVGCSHGVAKSWTWLSDFTFTFHFPALETEMATHSSVLASRIPGTWEPGGLPSMGSHRVRQNWSDLAAAAAEYLILWFFALLHFATIGLSLQTEYLWQPYIQQVYDAIIPTAFTHFLSLCHSLVILTLFQIFS